MNIQIYKIDNGFLVAIAPNKPGAPGFIVYMPSIDDALTYIKNYVEPTNSDIIKPKF